MQIKKERVSDDSSESDGEDIVTFNADVAEVVTTDEPARARFPDARPRSHSKVTVRIEKANSHKNFQSAPGVARPKSSGPKDDTRASIDFPRRDSPTRKKKTSQPQASRPSVVEDRKRVFNDKEKAKDHPDVFDKNTIKDIIHGLNHGGVDEPSTKDLQLDDYKYSFQVLSRPGQELLKFKHFAPKVFLQLRTRFGVTSEQFKNSFQLDNVKAVKGEGKSGAFFIFTKDRQFVLKTITGDERDFLWNMLPLYYQHMDKNPHSLLPKFYGVYSMKHEGIGGVTRFVIMNNVFNAFEPTEKYDLKGSSVGRTVAPKNRKPGAILKDLDIKQNNRFLYLSKTVKNDFERQLKKDSDFLAQNKVMDYSLLLGIYVEQDNVRKKQLEQTLDFDKFTGGNLNGIRSNALEIYYVGIIDVLIQYGGKKKFEHLLKSFQNNSDEVSVVAPKIYSKRFYNFLTGLIATPNDTSDEEKEKKSSESSEKV